MIPLCRKEGVGLIPWSPLGRGLLTRSNADMDATLRSRTDPFGKQLYDRDDADRAIIDAVGKVAKKRGVPNAQVALAWMLSRPAVTAPIVGASKMSHLDDAVAALAITLDDDEVKALQAPYRPRSIRGHA